MKKYILFFFFLFLSGIIIVPRISHATVIMDTTAGGIAGYVNDGSTHADLPSVTGATSSWYIGYNASSTNVDFSGVGCGFTSVSNSNDLNSINFCTADVSLWVTTSTYVNATSVLTNSSWGGPIVSELVSGTYGGNGGVFLGVPVTNLVVQVSSSSVADYGFNNWVANFGGSAGVGYAINGSDQPYMKIADNLNEAFTDGASPPVSAPSIHFTIPSETVAIAYPDIKNWKIRFNIDTASTTYFNVKIEWGNTSSTMTNFDLFPYDFQNSTPSTAGFLDIPLIVRKNISWTQGETIYARAQLYEYDCIPFSADCFRQIVNSDIINFTVDLTKKLTAQDFTTSTDPGVIAPIEQSIRDVTYVNNPNNFFGIASSTPTSTITAATAGCIPAADWTDIGGGLTYAGCSIINYLFVPSTSTLQNFGSVMQNIQGAPPFNFFFNANQQIGIQIAASSSAVGMAWELPYIGADGVSSDTLMLMPANAADIPFVGGGAGSFVNDLWNLILDFMMLLCLAIVIVAGKFFIDLI